MSHNFLFNASFHEALLAFDLSEANRPRNQGCPYCAGALHQAHFPRKAFGVTAKLRHLYAKRFSFCCAACRRRTTPSSVRFRAKIRFISSVFVLISAIRKGASEARCDALARRFGVRLSTSTWQRWRSWWRDLPNTVFWRQAKPRFSTLITPSPDKPGLARGLLKQFTGPDLSQRLHLLLRFLSPLSL
jgi:hypothetical protein